MSEATTLESPKVHWDLSALFSGLDDPKIETTWKTAEELAETFATKYRDKVADLSPQELKGAIAELEAIYQNLAKPIGYAGLRHATDSGNAEIGAFYQSQVERYTALNVKLMFFELELQKAPNVDPDSVGPYAHYVRTARALSPYRLSEKEEIIMEEFANTGSRAWDRLFDELTANHTYHLDGKETTQEELLTLLRDADRNKRQAAAESFTKGLKEMERTLVFLYNTLLQDKAVEDRLRGMEYPEQSRHLSNELDKSTVDLVVELCVENYPLVARYYKVKRQILGLPEMTHIDRYAPLFDTEAPVAWDEAKGIVLGSFGAFSEEMSRRAQEFFDKNWIDAEARKGKRGGAFCSYNTPDTHPVILQSYQNRMDDVMTLAHELGHGVHASLSREQSYLNFHGTLPLAELASTFGEMLVFERLVADASLKDKLALYADKCEGTFATIFRQASMFRFEQRVHNHRRTKGELTAEEFGDAWQEEIGAMFGDSLTLGEGHRMWWSYVGHFIGSPFYVYAYSFGELLALALFQKAKEEGPSFQEKYLSVLRLGGSETPQQLMGHLGIDLDDRSFWQGGFRVVEGLVSEFERLWAEYSKQA
jgi:oligoendopeptidase F